MLFADLLSLHLVTFFILVVITIHESMSIGYNSDDKAMVKNNEYFIPVNIYLHVGGWFRNLVLVIWRSNVSTVSS